MDRNDSEKVLARLRGIKYLKKGSGTGGGNVGTMLMKDPQLASKASLDNDLSEHPKKSRLSLSPLAHIQKNEPLN